MFWHLAYFILKVFAWKICNMKWGFPKKFITESQRQFMYGSNFYESDVRWEKKISWCFNSTFRRLSRCSAYVHMTQNINYLDLKKLDKLKIAIRTSFLVFHNIRSDCHYSDVINILLNAFRLKKKVASKKHGTFQCNSKTLYDSGFHT